MDKIKVCPMFKEVCKEKSCAWYNKDANRCAMLSIAENIDDVGYGFRDVDGIKCQVVN